MKAKQKKTGNFIIGFSAAFWRLILCCMIVCMRIERKENFMKIKSLPEEERPVEKAILAGAQCLSNAELLAVILGSGTKEKSAIGLAEEVLAQGSGGLAELADCTAQELTKSHGVGQFKAARILASVELGKRIATRPRQKRVSADDADQVAALFMEDMRYSKRETFKALLLNAKGEIISIETVSVGELTSTLVHPREVFHQAVKKSAAAILFVHNHPSGDPTPSAEDFKTTQMLVECGNLLRIKVVDHLIIGDGRYVSMQGMGCMQRA